MKNFKFKYYIFQCEYYLANVCFTRTFFSLARSLIVFPFSSLPPRPSFDTFRHEPNMNYFSAKQYEKEIEKNEYFN